MDEHGTSCLNLGFDTRDFPGVHLRDEQGMPRASLGFNQTGPLLYPTDRTGRDRIGAAFDRRTGKAFLFTEDEFGTRTWESGG